eukprot:m.32071 g.32071  ORF g.32071 m.32071 type:complete len:57 (-) comp7001_c0_seq1:155-325(-)
MSLTTACPLIEDAQLETVTVRNYNSTQRAAGSFLLPQPALLLQEGYWSNIEEGNSV